MKTTVSRLLRWLDGIGLLLLTIVLLFISAEAHSVPAAGDPVRKLESGGGWIGCRTANFALYSNANAGKTRKVAVQLERFRQALGRITSGFELDTDVPTSMFVFKNDVVYKPYKYDRAGNLMNVSGYFLPRPFHNYITLDISAGARPMRVVYHEFFHAVMDASLGSLPVWLNEGLAEYFSTFKDRQGTAVEVGHPIEQHLQHLQRYGLLPWNEVFTTNSDSPTYNEKVRQGSFYAQSWLLVHYLNATDARSQALGRYLTLLRSGTDDEDAFAEAFGKARAEVGAAATAYLETGGNFVRWDFGEEHGDVEVTIEELQPAEVLYRLGDLLAHGGRREEAQRHLEAAAAAGWPKPAVRSAQALAEYYAQRPQAAETKLREAVSSGATAVEPYVVLSWLLYDRFLAAPESRNYSTVTPQAITEIRQILERGTKDKPKNFHALTALARTYLFDAGDVAPGVVALEQARRLRPLDLDLQQTQASLLGRAGHPRAAWTLIEKTILPKDPQRARETGEYVVSGLTLTVMQRAEAGDRDGAVTLLDDAIAAITDPRLNEGLRRMREVVSSGGRIIMSDDDDQAQAAAEIQEYNRAVEMASSGKQQEALALLDSLAETCTDEAICELAREGSARLRQIVENNRIIGRINEAVREANSGNRKKAVEILRELESEAKDSEALQRVQEVLKSMGARPARKK